MRQLKITNNLTPRNEMLKKYFKDISRYAMITPEEEVELAIRIKEGDREALNKMVTSNLRFVVSIAKKYQSPKTPLEDLIACGSMGLIKAATHFDETRGFKFITYAAWWIHRSILEEITKNGRTVRLPNDIYSLMNKVKRQSSYLEQKNETSPTIEDIASGLGINIKEIKKIIPFVEREVSLDEPFQYNREEDDDRNRVNFLPSNEFQTNDYGLLIESRKSDLKRALNTLKKNEIEILKKIFDLDRDVLKPEKEINESIYYTRAHISQIKKKALRKLKDKLSQSKINSLIKEIEKIKLDIKDRKTKVEKVELCEKNFLGKKIKALKIFATNYKDLHDIADKLGMPEIEKRRGYDLSFITHYILEKKLKPLSWYEIEGKMLNNSNEFGGIDSVLEVDFCVKVEKIKEIENKKFKPKVLAYDIETDAFKIGEGEILMISLVSDDFKKVLTYKSPKEIETNLEYVEYVKDEAELLEKFVEYVKKISPDFLVGYFSDGFDLPYLKARAEKFNVKLSLGLDGSQPKFSR